MPFRLSMGTDLALASDGCERTAFRDAQRASELYETWLWHAIRQKRGHDRTIPDDIAAAEGLAWDLHCLHRTQAPVGPLGTRDWFRCLPLRVHDFHPQSHFSFKHKSLQEFLVARHLWRCLTRPAATGGGVADGTDAEAHALQALDLRRDFPVLRFFGDLLHGDADKPGRARAQERLLAMVARSRGAPARGLAAANSISLLNAAGVSLAGRDLRGTHVPGAALQCANLSGADLRGANLRGADLQGAVLDCADLRGADLTDVDASQLLRTLEGHAGAVLSVALSRDARTLVTGSEDTAVRVWDGATGQLLRTLKGHARGVRAVALSGDGQTVVSGSSDTTIRVVDATTGALVQMLRGHSDGVGGVACSLDGRLVLSGSDDGTARFWDAAGGRLLHTCAGHEGPVCCVALSRNADMAATGSGDKTVRVWDLRTGNCLQVPVPGLKPATMGPLALFGRGWVTRPLYPNRQADAMG